MMENKIATANTTRETILQMVDDAKEPAKAFFGGCYTDEVKMIDEAQDMTTAEKLAARRETNLLYGLLALVGFGGLALLRCL